MRLVVRADDYGYTQSHNAGTRKAIEEGIVTSVDIMLDCPGTEEAIEILKNYPWLSVGWHTHFWGKPVLGADKVPSMVNGLGRFKWRRNMSLQDTVDYDEAVEELRAQIIKCIQLLGRAPDTLTPQLTDMDRVMDRARKAVCDEFGIHYNFFAGKFPRTGEIIPADEKYRHLKISEFDNAGNSVGLTYKDIEKFKDCYDPVKFMKTMDPSVDETYILPLHPGYLDDYILAESSCTIARVKDVEALCSQEIKDWIVENKVELINFRDALYGTSEYQNHLKAVGSKLKL